MVRPARPGRKQAQFQSVKAGPTLRVRDTEPSQLAGDDETTGLSYQVITPDRLGVAPWRSLNANSLTPSPFYDPAFIAANAAYGGKDAVRLMVVRDPANADGLKAIWPFVGTSVGPAAAFAASETFATHYSPLAMPIIDRDRSKQIIRTALYGFCQLAPLMVMPSFAVGSDAGKAILTTADELGLSHISTGQAQRAALTGRTIFREYAAEHWSSQRRAKIRRYHRRLAKKGDVAFRVASAGTPWPEAEAHFLAMEEAGWKGRGGTAMASSQSSRAIVETVCRRMVPAGLAEVHALTVDGAPIAMLILFRLRGHVLTWKITFDEAYAALSPGHLLFAEVTQKIIARGDVHADSCSTEDHSLADAYWGQSTDIATVHLAVRPGTAGRVALGVSAAQAAAMDVARSAYRAVRRGR